ncbi:MAG: YbaN family protein [Acidimicrobiia bacterium]
MAVTVARSRVTRWWWRTCGLACVGLGSLGVIVPGLPTTVFFIGAVWCFSRSSPRLERWVLGLPGVGPMVRDHRAGLGMPRRAKVTAVAMIAAASGLSLFLVGSPVARAAIVAAVATAIWVVVWRVPTREAVLAARAAAAPAVVRDVPPTG